MGGALAILSYCLVGVILYTQVGYGAALYLLWRLSRALFPAPAAGPAPQPRVSLVIAAYNEQRVIEARVANARALAYPRELLEVIVSCDGCTDRTAELARRAGADLVLEGPRAGKVRAQDRAVERASGEIVAFADANCMWDRYALRALLSAFVEPRTAYACGQVRYLDPGSTSQEGVYWRYELWLRRLESELCSVTAGNGGIYAVRRDDYLVVDAAMGHDLSFPFQMVKRGRRARYVPAAVAEERMVPSLEGEFARKRRMMAHTWPILLTTSMLSPRGYPPLYYWMILSHRLARYLCPLLHLAALAGCAAAAALGGGPAVLALLWAQGLVIVAFLLGRFVAVRPLLLARHYLFGQAAILLGLYDWLRRGTPATWSQAEGTR